MAKVCDVDSGREDVEVVSLGVVLDTGVPAEALFEFDACGSCRSLMANGGLSELMQRYGAAHKLLKRPRKPT